jgi:hypothetical protein
MVEQAEEEFFRLTTQNEWKLYVAVPTVFKSQRVREKIKKKKFRPTSSLFASVEMKEFIYGFLKTCWHVTFKYDRHGLLSASFVAQTYYLKFTHR